MTYALLALDASNTELVLHANSNLADGSNTANHRVLPVAEMLQVARPVLVLCADFWRVTLRPDHAAADTHDGILVVEVLVRTSDHVALALISQATHHHVGRAGGALCHDPALHDDVVVLDYGDTAAVALHVASVVVLSLDDVTANHLGILDLDVRVIQNEVVIIYILYNLDRLLVALILFAFRLRAAAASSVRPMHAHLSRVAHLKVVHPTVRVLISRVAHMRAVLVV